MKCSGCVENYVKRFLKISLAHKLGKVQLGDQLITSRTLTLLCNTLKYVLQHRIRMKEGSLLDQVRVSQRNSCADITQPSYHCTTKSAMKMKQNTQFISLKVPSIQKNSNICFLNLGLNFGTKIKYSIEQKLAQKF